MKRPKPKPYIPGLVRGQLLLRTPLRVATTLVIQYEPTHEIQPMLEYSTREESPNERSRRLLKRSMPAIKVHRAVVTFTPEEERMML
jgi:hypothetical protein